MEKFKGTPGPWRIDDKDPTFSALAGDTYHLIKAGGGYHDDEKNKGFSISGFMSIHDANLISAAPELLEALQDALHAYDKRGEYPEWDFARAAIKKALGE